MGARRVLPGHLLRRSRVLSTLRLGGSFTQRMALTACTGEESVFEWSLQLVPDGPDYSSSSDEEGGPLLPAYTTQPGGLGARNSSAAQESTNSGGRGSEGRGGRWAVASVRRDGSCDVPLPTTPHPK